MNGRTWAAPGAMLAAVVLLAGCASMQTTEWTGHTNDEVIKEFGPPNQTVPDSDGETMYLWSFYRVSPGNPGTTWCFLVNREGTVVSWHLDDVPMRTWTGGS